MRGLALVIGLLLFGAGIWAQSTPQVLAYWTLETTTATSWEMEIDGALVVPCPSPVAEGLERRCGPVPVSGGTHTFRLRGVNSSGSGAWSGTVSYTVPAAPGVYRIRRVLPPPGR